MFSPSRHTPTHGGSLQSLFMTYSWLAHIPVLTQAADIGSCAQHQKRSLGAAGVLDRAHSHSISGIEQRVKQTFHKWNDWSGTVAPCKIAWKSSSEPSSVEGVAKPPLLGFPERSECRPRHCIGLNAV